MSLSVELPQGIAFKSVVAPAPEQVQLKLPDVPVTPALDLLKAGATQPKLLEINCREAIGPALAEQARLKAYATGADSIYAQVRTNSIALRQFGVDTLQSTNDQIDSLFSRQNFDNLAAATEILKKLRRNMLKLTNKYNPGNPKILEWYNTWEPTIVDMMRGIKTVGKLIAIELEPLKAQMDAVTKQAKNELKGIDETLGYYAEMRAVADKEAQTLMYINSIMEYMQERAQAEFDAMPTPAPGNPFNHERDDLSRFMHNLDLKLTDFKAQLWLLAANTPKMIEMENLTQSVAMKMASVINLLIPSMKQTLVDWNLTASTVKAVGFMQEVSDATNESMQANARSSAAAVPILLNATETPLISLDTVQALAQMYDSMVTSIDTGLTLGNQKRAELRQAQSEALGVILSGQQKISEAYVRAALASGSAADTTPVSADWSTYAPGSVDTSQSDKS